MDEFELEQLDKEFADLLRSERRKTAFFVESLEGERREIAEAFNDHLVSMHSFEVDASIEELLLDEPRKLDTEEQEDYSAKLAELIRVDIGRYETLAAGEVRVSGEGLYMVDSTTDESSIEFLGDGDTIHGEIETYHVGPLVSYEAIMNREDESGEDFVDNLPALWVALNDVAIFDVAGGEQTRFDRVFVPVTFTSLRFDKVIRQSADTMLEGELADAKDQFSGLIFTETCTDIENDLNYNDHSPEDHFAVREAYRCNMAEKFKDIDLFERLLVSVQDAMSVNIEDVAFDLFKERVAYNGTPIIQVSGVWRVAHSFSVFNEEGEEIAIVNALPENIQSIYRYKRP